MTSSHSSDKNPVPAHSSSSSAAAGGKKPRSPVERAIVWGLIIVLGIVVLFEGRASFAFRNAFNKLQSRLDEAESQDDPMTESDVKAIVTGYSGEPVVNERLEPNLLNAKREDLYIFKGLIKNYPLYVYYGVQIPGKEREVLSALQEKAAPLPERFDFELPPPTVRVGPPSGALEQEEQPPGAQPSAEPAAETPAGEPAAEPNAGDPAAEPPAAEPATDPPSAEAQPQAN
jgi:hypothetical protein